MVSEGWHQKPETFPEEATLDPHFKLNMEDSRWDWDKEKMMTGMLNDSEQPKEHQSGEINKKNQNQNRNR